MRKVSTASFVTVFSLAFLLLFGAFFALFVQCGSDRFRDIPIGITNRTGAPVSVSVRVYSSAGSLTREVEYRLEPDHSVLTGYGLGPAARVSFKATDGNDTLIYDRSFTGRELWDVHGRVSIQ